jgi:RHH-type proline utilization regulon transcriptional repressor/proline dehydrogenase/delta 1-pyrroline-5-carboxylate dehydrogenase
MDFANEPLSDFGVAATREAMVNALRRAQDRIGDETFGLMIGGEEVKTDRTMDSVNPSHGDQVVGRIHVAGVQDANRAVAAARRAWRAWRATTVGERAAVLHRAAEGMRRQRFELAAWILLETGKPWREADADVAEAIDFCEFYAAAMEELAGRPRRRDVAGETNALIHAPRGVAVVIAPWNFPLAILTGMTTAALVAGNTVVMKPAEQSSVVAAKLCRLLIDAGAPAGVVNFLPGRGEELGPFLVGHADVDLIAFTGSRAVGLEIIERAARRIEHQRTVKKVIAEMGGKNAIIIDADADLDAAVVGVVHSTFGYAGQKCSACSRVIVLAAVHDIFVERLEQTTLSLRVGPAEDPSTDVGPLIDADARARVSSYIERGKTEARILVQMEVGDAGGFYVGPTIFDQVPPTAVIAREEIFGPVLSIVTATDFDDAIEIANSTDYALTGGVYSRRPAHIERAKRDFEVGNLYVNRRITGALVDRQPFGGYRLSGIGSKAGGPDYLRQFCTPKSVTENTMRHGFAPESPAPRS